MIHIIRTLFYNYNYIFYLILRLEFGGSTELRREYICLQCMYFVQ